MKQSDFEDFIIGLGDCVIDRETEKGLVLFKASGKIYAIIHDSSKPLRLEAKCDRRLAKLLRTKYESILPSKNMDKKVWNEIICSGQLDYDEVKDLLRLSYNLVITEEDEI
jgi:Uncharacterized protein conserved in bacteria